MSGLLNTLRNYPYDCQLRYLLDNYKIADIVRQIIEWIETDTQDNDVNKAHFMTFARDFYIGSDLTQPQKDDFYTELTQQGFFTIISTYLYSSDVRLSSWTIYTFGKFSMSENALFLETAYETNFSLHNPILSARCLGELQWLKLPQVDAYIKQLQDKNDILSKFTLLNYWESFCDAEFERLLGDNELVAFLSPDSPNISKDDILKKLVQFEQYFWQLLSDATDNMTHDKFFSIAENFFHKAPDL